MKLITYIGKKDIYVRFINHDDTIEKDIDRMELSMIKNIDKAFNECTDQIEIYEIPEKEFEKNPYINRDKYLVGVITINCSLIEELVEFNIVEPDFRNGILLRWAYIHNYLSVAIYLMTYYKDKLSPLLHHVISSIIVERSPCVPILQYLINKCGYSIHQDDEILLRRCLTTKNYSASRFLLEAGARIPYGLYMGFYNNRNQPKFKPIYKLLKEYERQVEEQ